MKNKGLWLVIVIILIIIAVLAWYFAVRVPSVQAPTAATTTPSTASSGRSLITTVVYTCDKGKTITAAYYNGSAAATSTPGEPPTPTGSVDVSIGGAPTTTLPQTISADGIRYSNSDDSLTFWSKGNTALVMRNNSMDLDYTNCATATTTAK